MAIVLRADTGSALSHNQVDINFTSFYYSSSLNGNILTLFTTGSNALGITVASSSITLPVSNLWTSSIVDISRNSDVTITGSLKQGSAGLVTTGLNSHAEGLLTQATGWYSHAEGRQTQGRGSGSHAEGYLTIATASYSHAEGVATQARGIYSHAEGNASIASGSTSHAEGLTTNANGEGSHTEGVSTSADGYGAHAEGFNTSAMGTYSHAEGESTQANGIASHAEGLNSQALGNYSHAEGFGTVASGSYQHVQGQYNISSSVQSAFIVGNGTSSTNRRNLVFTSGSIFQVSGSLQVSGNTLLPRENPVYFGNSLQGSTSSYAIFRDSSNRLTIGNNVGEAYGSDGIKIDTSGKVQLNHVSQDYGLYDTTLNIIGSGSNDGITMTEWPNITNRYRITVQSGSTYNLNFNNSLHPSSGSYNFSGSVSITNDLFLNGNKQFNYGMFYHTASITVSNGISGSAPFSTTVVSNGISIVSGSRITVTNPGFYNIQLSAQLAQGANTANFYLWFKKNGVNIPNSNSKKTLTNNTNQIMTIDIIDYASNVGDYYEISHQSDAANSSLDYIPASGNYPAAPSITVTVHQVR